MRKLVEDLKLDQAADDEFAERDPDEEDDMRNLIEAMYKPGKTLTNDELAKELKALKIMAWTSGGSTNGDQAKVYEFWHKFTNNLPERVDPKNLKRAKQAAANYINVANDLTRSWKEMGAAFEEISRLLK